MSDDPQNAVSPSNALVQGLIRMLRPLVRLLIRRQISYPFFAQLLKTIYLEVALEGEQDKRLNDSRVSLITGVHRKDVRRLRQENETVAIPEIRPASLGAQVIATWLNEHADEQGEPKPLFVYENQGYPSFEHLVEETSRHDVRARALLDEWKQIGMVRVDEHNMVHLQKAAFIPASNFDEKVFFFGHHLHDHMAACVDNLLQDQPRFFERGVYYNNLRQPSVDQLKTYIDHEAMVLLKKINNKARELQKQDSGQTDADLRFRYGAYFFSDETDARKQEKKDAKKS